MGTNPLLWSLDLPNAHHGISSCESSYSSSTGISKMIITTTDYLNLTLIIILKMGDEITNMLSNIEKFVAFNFIYLAKNGYKVTHEKYKERQLSTQNLS